MSMSSGVPVGAANYENDSFHSADEETGEDVSPSAPSLDDLEPAGFADSADAEEVGPTPSAPTLQDLEDAGFALSPPPATAPPRQEKESAMGGDASTENSSTEETINEATSKKEEITCGICSEPISESSSSCCSGTTPHYVCDTCFCSYARAELAPSGSYECERRRTPDPADDQDEITKPLVSEPGQLPCYLFLAGNCDCTAIPKTTFARVLSTDESVLDMYEAAKRRRIEADVEAARKKEEEARAAAKARETASDALKARILDALTWGAVTPCPSCDAVASKDDACMHMTCACGTRYCYCCGRPRGLGGIEECPSDGFGCDTPSPCLEEHPGWSNLALPESDETEGMGALQEFHRLRMAYYLRLIKDDCPNDVWEDLRRTSPEILDEVPTVGRGIGWDEIDYALPPLFGETEADELRWKEIPTKPEEDFSNTTRQNNTTTLDGDILGDRRNDFTRLDGDIQGDRQDNFTRVDGDIQGTSSDQSEATDENGETSTCGICSEPVRTVEASFCVGTTPHCLCETCFCGYARAELDATGAFEGEREGNDGVVSRQGELPCYQFMAGGCDCASVPATTIARVLSSDADVLQLYENAKRRIIAAEEERARQRAEEVQREVEARETPVDRLRAVVHEAMSRGCRVQCPRCHISGQKNDACMHMTCPCGTPYCYCCGRRRGNGAGACPSGGGGCDSTSCYLEHNPGWGNFAINSGDEDENPGLGALHEFHRRRIMYFLRQVKAAQPPGIWAQLRAASPEILINVPTRGRRIDWDQIDNARPPLFGATDVDQLTWAEEGREATADVEEEQRQQQQIVPHAGGGGGGANEGGFANEQERIDDDPYSAWLKSYDDNRLLLIWGLAVVVTLVLLACRVASDGTGLRVVGSLGLAFIFVTSSPVVLNAAIDRRTRRPNGCCSCINEVQFFGQREGRVFRQPYLSTGGRWHRFRMLYWLLFVGPAALGSIIVEYADGGGLYAMGVMLLTAAFFFYGFASAIVNVAPRPEDGQERVAYIRALRRLVFHGIFFSVGVGLLAGYNDNNSAGRIAGKCFFAIGFSGGFSEICPRLVVWCYSNNAFRHPLSRTPDAYRLLLSYCFFEGLAAGSLMVGLTCRDSDTIEDDSILFNEEADGCSDEGLRRFGIATLVLTIIGTWLAWYYVVRSRPV